MILHHFAALSNYNSNSTNADGAAPRCSLVLSGNVLYGTATAGGSSGNGTVFMVNTGGAGFMNLHNFTALSSGPLPENSDGAQPQAGLILSGSAIFGTAQNGGSSSGGTVFALGLAPSLGISAEGTKVVLTWPTWAPNFALQMTTNPSLGSWSNINSGVTPVGSSYTFTNEMNGRSAIFRLQSQ
jgi:uncharacterized repeat protein (TIGR03803 family)